MLGKVNCNRLIVRKQEAMLMFGTFTAILVSESQVQVGNLSKTVSLQIVYEVVRKLFTLRLLLQGRWLRVNSRINHLFNTQVADQLLIPADEVHIAV